MRAAWLALVATLAATLAAWGQANPVGRVWTYSGTPTAGDCTASNYGHVAIDNSGATGLFYDCAKAGGVAAWVLRPISSGTLAQFSATTSSQLAGVISNETGSGALVFGTSPSLTTPAIGSGGFTIAGATSGTTTVAATATASGTLTLPAATDTLVGRATTDTLTNKTYDTAGTGNVLRINGTTVSAVTGSGSVVLATSPSLTTPSLGAATGTSLAVTGGSLTARAASTQDAVILTGRAGGTNSYGVTLTPTTLTASRTVTLADGNTTLQAGTMAITGGTMAQFASTTSAQLAGVISNETGSGALVFGTSPTIATPTITTSAVIPIVNGGTTASSTLTMQSTSGSGTSDAIIFQTASQSERMRINTSGNLGLGTSSPGVRFHVLNGSQLTSVPSAGSYGGPVIVGNDNTLYGLYMGSISNGNGYIQQQRGDSATTYELLLQPNGGNVLIGYTSSNGSYKLQVNSQIFATNATIATSDRKYKQKIQPLRNALEVIERLNPVSFEWAAHDIHNFDAAPQIGFVAQEVQAALAQTGFGDSVVKKNKIERGSGVVEEFLGMAESKLVPFLVRAMQELSLRVAALEAKK